MDILYIYKNNNNGGLDLKYSLRSIAKYGKNIDRVFLVGDNPGFLSDNVIYVACPDKYNTKSEKAKNILSKIEYAVKNTDISDDFLVSMDNHYYCKETDFNSYPYYRRINKRNTSGLLPDYIEHSWGSKGYAQILLITRRFLEERNLPVHTFVLHKNMHINKKAVTDAKDLIKDSYGTAYGIESFCLILNYLYSISNFEYVDSYDNKYNNENIQIPKDSECFSTVDFEENSNIHLFLEGLFPEKCKYEK